MSSLASGLALSYVKDSLQWLVAGAAPLRLLADIYLEGLTNGPLLHFTVWSTVFSSPQMLRQLCFKMLYFKQIYITCLQLYFSNLGGMLTNWMVLSHCHTISILFVEGGMQFLKSACIFSYLMLFERLMAFLVALSLSWSEIYVSNVGSQC